MRSWVDWTADITYLASHIESELITSDIAIPACHTLPNCPSRISDVWRMLCDSRHRRYKTYICTCWVGTFSLSPVNGLMQVAPPWILFLHYLRTSILYYSDMIDAIRWSISKKKKTQPNCDRLTVQQAKQEIFFSPKWTWQFTIHF